MKISALLLGAVSAASMVLAAPTASAKKPDLAAQVVDAIYAIGNNTVALNNTLNTFQPNQLLGAFTALQIQQQTSDLTDSITNAASVANQSAKWSQTESFTIAIAVVDLEPTIFSTLRNIVQHKPAFASAVIFVGDLTKTVQADLIKQQELSREFGSAVAAKLDPSLAGQAPIITTQIYHHFGKAISAYKACTGLICLPPIGGW